MELCFNDVWGTVCHDSWNNTDARTICQILGHIREDDASLGAAIATQGNFFDVAVDARKPVLLDEVGCTGTESSILECPSEEVGEHNCFGTMNAGVFCTG